MPISAIKSISADCSLGLWKITETPGELSGMISLTSTEKEELASKKTDRRRQEWLACRVLLRFLTGENLHISHDQNRKPHITGDSRHISLSHSGGFAAVCIDRNFPVGIDIQQLKPSISRGADYFLNEEEQKWVDIDDNVLLHLIWSAKESVFKLAGDPELELRKHITTKQFSRNQNGRFEVSLFKTDLRSIAVCYEIFEDYVLTWTC